MQRRLHPESLVLPQGSRCAALAGCSGWRRSRCCGALRQRCARGRWWDDAAPSSLTCASLCGCVRCRAAAVAPAEHAERLPRPHHLLGRLVEAGPDSQRLRRQCDTNIWGGWRGGRQLGGGAQRALALHAAAGGQPGRRRGCRGRGQRRRLLRDAVQARAGAPAGYQLRAVAPHRPWAAGLCRRRLLHQAVAVAARRMLRPLQLSAIRERVCSLLQPSSAALDPFSLISCRGAPCAPPLV